MTSLGSEGNKEVEPGLSRSLGKDLVRPNPFLTSWQALGRLLLSPILSLCPSTWCSASPPLAHWWSWTGTSEPMSQNPKTKQPSNQNTKIKQRDHFGCLLVWLILSQQRKTEKCVICRDGFPKPTKMRFKSSRLKLAETDSFLAHASGRRKPMWYF